MPAVKMLRVPPKSILVLRALQLGDMLCAVPALRALRRAAPRARIALVGLPWAAAFAARFDSYVDEFIEFPGYPGLPERAVDVRALPAFFESIQARRFELAVQLHGSGSHVNSVTALFGAERSAGFFMPGDPRPDPEGFVPYPRSGTEVERLLSLTEALGAPGDTALEFPLREDDQAQWRSLSARHDLVPGGFVCVHPGARWPSRRWFPERFAAVADALASRGLSIVLTGSEAERPLTAAVAAAMRRREAVDLAGRTSLGGLAALLSHAKLLVCNDTGVSHVAAALGVRSVVVATGSDVARWSPQDGGRHKVISVHVDCRPCDYFECPIGHPCAADVTVERVAEQALQAAA